MFINNKIRVQIEINEREIKNLKHAIRCNMEIIEANEHDLVMGTSNSDLEEYMSDEIFKLTRNNEELERKKHKLEKINADLNKKMTYFSIEIPKNLTIQKLSMSVISGISR